MTTNKQPAPFSQEAKASPTRRALLCSMAAATTLAATLAAPSIAVAAPSRAAWDAAMRHYTTLKAEDDAFNAVFKSLYEQCEKAEKFIAHIAFRPDPFTGLREPVSTADHIFVRQARRLVQNVAVGKCQLDPLPDLQAHYSLCKEVASAADKRDSKIAAVRARFRMDEAEAKWEALGEATYGAEWAVMDLPSPDLAALRWKLEKLLLIDDGSVPSWSATAVAATMADVRRLLSGEA